VATGDVEFVLVRDWRQKFVPGITKMMEKLGEQMVAEARDIAPEATGFLKDSIFFKIDRQPRNSLGQFQTPEVIIGASAPYALYVEMGHFSVAGNWVEAQPFLRPVIYAHRQATTK
jgi:hypothetical protein